MASSAALSTLILYLSTLRNESVGVWDDNAYVVENAAIRSINATFSRWAFFDFHAATGTSLLGYPCRGLEICSDLPMFSVDH
jgi:hypothetical protein